MLLSFLVISLQHKGFASFAAAYISEFTTQTYLLCICVCYVSAQNSVDKRNETKITVSPT